MLWARDLDGEELVLVGFRFAWRFAQGRVIRRLFEALARRASQGPGTAHYLEAAGVMTCRSPSPGPACAHHLDGDLPRPHREVDRHPGAFEDVVRAETARELPGPDKDWPSPEAPEPARASERPVERVATSRGFARRASRAARSAPSAPALVDPARG